MTAPNPFASTDLSFLRLPEVRRKTGLSRSTIYARIAQGTFTVPIRCGLNCVAWSSREIDAWLGERIAERDSSDGAS